MLREIRVKVAGDGEWSQGIDHAIEAATDETNGSPTVIIKLDAAEGVRLDPEDAELLGIGLQRMALAAKREKTGRGY